MTKVYKEGIVATFTENLHAVLSNYTLHHRLQTFYYKGLTCVSCGRTGNKIVMWFQSNWNGDPTRGLHVDVMADDVLMTVDHHIPRSKGGSDDLSNKFPMCQPCNTAKAAQLPEEFYVEERANHGPEAGQATGQSNAWQYTLGCSLQPEVRA